MHFLSFHQHYCNGISKDLNPTFFLPRTHDSRAHALGRGTTWFFQYRQQNLVLRHYRRGGFIAKLLRDYYVYTGLSLTRAYREWHLLDDLAQKGLPVPQPYAFHIYKHKLFYQADIITREINNSMPLSQRLQQQALAPQLWQSIGKTITEFHAHDIYHADLNAHNILLDENDKVWLIDFDRGCFKPMTAARRNKNLNRLLRSLEKLSVQYRNFNFSENDISALKKGFYQ